jgi:DNA invertase Pin-like site-specific DNA recombinase
MTLPRRQRSRPRAALYHRVSTIDQDPTAARHELRAIAKRHGFAITLDIEETASAANNQRPGLVRVMGAATRGEIDVVLVWKLDRFGRSALDLLTRLRELENSRTRFMVVTQGIDIRPEGDSMSRLLLTMLSAIAEFERDLIIERTKLGLDRARRLGRRLGRPPVPQPPVSDVLILRAGGYTWDEVAAQLECSPWAARMAVKPGADYKTGREARREPPAEKGQ